MNNMPQMPGMPGLPKQELPSSGEAQAPQAPFTDESAVNPADSDVGLNTPSHDEDEVVVEQEDPFINPTPAIGVSLPGPSNVIVTASNPKKGIKVVATRKGFYNQMRYSEGDEFIIKSKEDFGDWMKCVDKELEKERVKHYEQKRLKARQLAERRRAKLEE